MRFVVAAGARIERLLLSNSSTTSIRTLLPSATSSGTNQSQSTLANNTATARLSPVASVFLSRRSCSSRNHHHHHRHHHRQRPTQHTTCPLKEDPEHTWLQVQNLTDLGTHPLGSLTTMEWKSAQQTMNQLFRMSTAPAVNASLRFLERLVEEQTQHPSPAGHWLDRGDARILDRLVIQWKHCAYMQSLVSPTQLDETLQQLSRQLPGLTYTIDTYNTITTVLVHQSSPEQAANVAEARLEYAVRASKTRPQLKPTVSIWNQTLGVWVKNGPAQDSSCAAAVEQKLNETLERMRQQGIVPDAVTWNTVLTAWTTSGLPQAPEKIAETLERMREKGGVAPNVVTWNTAMTYWASCGLPQAPAQMEAILKRMQKERVTPNVRTWTSFVTYWASSRSPDAPAQMETVLERMKQQGVVPDFVTWTNVMDYWVSSDSLDAPVKLQETLRRMQNEGVEPSLVTWNNLLAYWALTDSPDAPKEMKKILQRMEQGK